MMILTDCPRRLPETVPDPAAWTAWPRDDLPPADRALWRALGQGEQVWVAEAVCPGAPGFWSRLVAVARAPVSQFDVLRELLGGGPALPGPVATLALEGDNFHGHRGRGWVAARGNLHLCAALADCGLPARDGLALTALPAVAVASALRRATLGSLRARIKWVNDILIDGGKVAGVLTATQAQDDRLTQAVLGIGLNVAVAPALPPSPFLPSTASLAGAGVPLDLEGALAFLLGELALRYLRLQENGPGPLLDAYRAASAVIGRRVCVWDEGLDETAPPAAWPAPAARGLVAAIGDDLALHLEGAEAPVSKGRLALAEHCGPHGVF